ncbi:hypothetical protein CWI39_3803p0010 [Hamiltosporidium magnivora]|uniref:CCHC-type domain-containing protein n=1 Tax=Hamiltosporidium magnivora TaxID=148818 RepID=A0A4Q9KQ58_9MICR|nr:hypothetical protein CWI39_3803p0010 [Hamiltosporidium magnivora]
MENKIKQKTDINEDTFVQREEPTLLGYQKLNNSTYTIDLDSPELRNIIDLDLTILNEDLENKIFTLLYHSREINLQKCEQSKNEELELKRYFLDSQLCYSCGETGHTERKCPKRNTLVCILCSRTGHYKYNCPMLVCIKCQECGHRANACQERTDRRRFMMCRQCSGEHNITECPRKWRKYFYNRNSNNNVPVNKACPLCCGKNHFIDDCNVKKTKFSIFTSDFRRQTTYFPKK